MINEPVCQEDTKTISTCAPNSRAAQCGKRAWTECKGEGGSQTKTGDFYAPFSTLPGAPGKPGEKTEDGSDAVRRRSRPQGTDGTSHPPPQSAHSAPAHTERPPRRLRVLV